jgi:hypothetical protein
VELIEHATTWKPFSVVFVDEQPTVVNHAAGVTYLILLTICQLSRKATIGLTQAARRASM